MGLLSSYLARKAAKELPDYLLKQAVDAVEFGLMACAMQPALMSDRKRLCKLAWDWVIEHGRPTQEGVREAIREL